MRTLPALSVQLFPESESFVSADLDFPAVPALAPHGWDPTDRTGLRGAAIVVASKER